MKELILQLIAIVTANIGINKSLRVPFILKPEGYGVHTLENLQANPTKKTGTVKFVDVVSFYRYFKDHAVPDTSIIAINASTSSVSAVAILDYHQKVVLAGVTPAIPVDVSLAGWEDHKAIFEARFSEEWKAWFHSNNKYMDQETFAEFIESNQLDIVSPDGATMLELVQTLVAKTSVDFKSVTRLNNGANEFKYQEVIDGKAGKEGTMEIPTEFQLKLPIFYRGELHALKARFKYRIADKKLSLRFELINPHKILEEAVNRIADEIEVGSGIKPFFGSI